MYNLMPSVLKNGESSPDVIRRKNALSQSEICQWKNVKGEATLQALEVEGRSMSQGLWEAT